MTLRVLGGDFKQGRAHYDEIGFVFVNAHGVREPVPFGAVEAVYALGSEDRRSLRGRIAGATGGGLVGGVTAGALSGATAGPAGALAGAVAGALLFGVRRNYMTCRIDFRDGRSAIVFAEGQVWVALDDLINSAPIVPVTKPDGSPRAADSAFDKRKGLLSRLNPAHWMP